MAEKGYALTTVADVLKRAKVSRDTFYQQFDSKQSCFQASFECHRRRVIEAVLSAPVSGSSIQQFDTLLGRYLQTLADEPDTARLYLVEVFAAGPEMIKRRTQLQGDFVTALVAIFDARGEQGRFACRVLIAAISSLTTATLVAGDVTQLLALRAPLVALADRLFDS